MNVGIRQQTFLLTAVPLAFLIFLAVLAGLLVNRTQQIAGYAQYSSRVLAAADQIVKAVGDANTAAVAYSSKHLPRDDATFERAAEAVSADVRTLTGLSAGDPGRAADAAAFGASALGARAIISKYVRLQKSGNASAVKALVASAEMRRVGADWSAAKSRFDVREHARSVAAFAGQRRALENLNALLLGCSVLGAALTVVVALLFGLRLTRRLRSLGENARRLGAGEATLPIEGTDEIAALEGVYHEMARRIEETALQREAAVAAYEHEHHVATTLQHALLPQDLDSVPGVRFEGVYEPGRSDALIGGDWYDAVRLADGRVLISIGDVAGNGLEAAVIMSSMRQVIRGVAQVYADPATMIDAADRTLRIEHPDTMVTAFVGVFDSVASTLSYCCAGHPAPLVREPDGSIGALPSGGLPLGLRLRGEAEADARTVRIADGTLVLFYTDGLTESRHDVIEGERLLREALARTTFASPGLVRSLYDTLLIDGSTDDVAILAMYAGDRVPAGGVASTRSRWAFDTADVQTARASRSVFVEALEARGLAEADVIRAELIFGELLGNAVRYAPGPVEIVLDWQQDSALLHVLDRGAGFILTPRLPSDIMSERGRGLFLVWMLADEFNVTKRADGGSHARVLLNTRRYGRAHDAAADPGRTRSLDQSPAAH